MKIATEEFTRKYKKYKPMIEMGMRVVPSDINTAFVPLDKHNPTNLLVTADDIQRRFNFDDVDAD